ncbi:MAG: pyridoxamine 5'-phosphate oxidase family protein [Clostridiales bacterium]|nr:pyridoxamine 5'-phosphate oxidase family protein [Clostridiales bacterium]
MKINANISAIMAERFGHDNLIALATLDGDSPAVRTVDAFYEGGAFYTVTYALSGKMQQISKNPKVAICGDWFTARGTAESMGHILLPENAAIADKLRVAFAEWYANGHTNEADPNTIILRIRLTDGVLFHHGTRYDITI